MAEGDDEGALTQRLNDEQKGKLDRRSEEIAKEISDMQAGVQNVQQGNVGSRPAVDYKRVDSA